MYKKYQIPVRETIDKVTVPTFPSNRFFFSTWSTLDSTNFLQLFCLELGQPLYFLVITYKFGLPNRLSTLCTNYTQMLFHSMPVTMGLSFFLHNYDYSTAIHYFVFAFCSLFTASMSSVMSSKVALVLVALLFCTYYVGFYHLNGYYYYFSQLLMGLGYACRLVPYVISKYSIQ